MSGEPMGLTISSDPTTATVGQAWARDMTELVDGGGEPYRFTLEHADYADETAATWLKITEGGVLHGTPDEPGVVTVEVSVADGSNPTLNASWTFDIDVVQERTAA